MDLILTIICAVIPDPVEGWLAGGGNVAIIFAVSSAYLLVTLLRPGLAVGGGDHRNYHSLDTQDPRAGEDE